MPHPRLTSYAFILSVIAFGVSGLTTYYTVWRKVSLEVEVDKEIRVANAIGGIPSATLTMNFWGDGAPQRKVAISRIELRLTRSSDGEALWFEVPEAALYLEAARTLKPEPDAPGQPPMPFVYPLIATLLLTGGRQDEVLGLEVEDVDFDRKLITFRPNEWRRLKTAKSARTVPLWPQLEAILRPYVFGSNSPPARLLFPSYRTGEEAMLTDVRKLLDRVTAHAGTLYVMDEGRKRKAEADEIRTKVFRHTYISTRLQTVDHGAPVAAWTVAREVGHSSTAMIEKTYGHLGQARHRAETVEYRVEQHIKTLEERLQQLVCRNVRQTEGVHSTVAVG